MKQKLTKRKFVRILGSPTGAKISRAPRTPKTVPKKLAATARQMSPMEAAASSPPVPRKVNTRRNTMAANAMDGDQFKMVRRSARVIAKKTEWECEDMPPPSPYPAKRAMSVKKSTVKTSVRKTLVCGDDDEDSDAANLPSEAPRKNYVRLLSGHQSSEDEGKVENMANESSAIPDPTEAHSESTVENVNDVSGTDFLSEDEQEQLPSVSMLGAKLKASKIQSSDSETENLPSVSILGASESKPENMSSLVPAPKTKKMPDIPVSVSAQKKTRSTRSTLVCGDDDDLLTDDSEIQPFKCTSPSKDVQSNAEANKTAPTETSSEPAGALNETNGDKKNGTFDISKEDMSGVNLLTEDESDAEEKHNQPSVNMLAVEPKHVKSPEIAKSDSEHESLPSVSMLATKTDRKIKHKSHIDTRISIVDLTNSPAIKKTALDKEPIKNDSDAESAATSKVNDKTFSPLESTVAPKPATSTWLALPPTGTKPSTNAKSPSPLKVHTPFKRKSPRISNGASKKPLTSAKKKCLLSLAKEAIAERTSNKQVAFSSPAKERTRTPTHPLSMRVKKTPYRPPTEGKQQTNCNLIYSKITNRVFAFAAANANTTNENDEPTTSIAGSKTPGKMPDFGKMHKKLFANMESLDSAVVRVDERAKGLLSGKKVPTVGIGMYSLLSEI